MSRGAQSANNEAERQLRNDIINYNYRFAALCNSSCVSTVLSLRDFSPLRPTTRASSIIFVASLLLLTRHSRSVDRHVRETRYPLCVRRTRGKTCLHRMCTRARVHTGSSYVFLCMTAKGSRKYRITRRHTYFSFRLEAGRNKGNQCHFRGLPGRFSVHDYNKEAR